ncbi:hypothetical protein, partial [Nocardia cyriacigeorgica]|uniref:hypothetical protein n=1 Tax=Nocardia cyriacigeorgica TaxID=135487 RepID=UPI0024572D57
MTPCTWSRRSASRSGKAAYDNGGGGGGGGAAGAGGGGGGCSGDGARIEPVTVRWKVPVIDGQSAGGGVW